LSGFRGPDDGTWRPRRHPLRKALTERHPLATLRSLPSSCRHVAASKGLLGSQGTPALAAIFLAGVLCGCSGNDPTIPPGSDSHAGLADIRDISALRGAVFSLGEVDGTKAVLVHKGSIASGRAGANRSSPFNRPRSSTGIAEDSGPIGVRRAGPGAVDRESTRRYGNRSGTCGAQIRPGVLRLPLQKTQRNPAVGRIGKSSSPGA
jgi:hypothetical protein